MVIGGDESQLLVLLLGGGAVGLAVVVGILVRAWRLRPWPPAVWRHALLLATLILAVRLPYQAISVATFDLSGTLEDLATPLADLISRRTQWALLLATGLTAVASWGLHLLCVPVAHAAHAAHTARGAPAFPWLDQRPTPAQLGPLFAGGLALGIVVGWFTPAPDLTFHPTLATAPALALPWSLSRAVGSALGQELLWRGVVQRTLVARLGAGGVALTVLLATVPAVSGPLAGLALAALLHTALGVLAYRTSVHHTLLLHLVAATVGALLSAAVGLGAG